MNITDDCINIRIFLCYLKKQLTNFSELPYFICYLIEFKIATFDVIMAYKFSEERMEEDLENTTIISRVSN